MPALRKTVGLLTALAAVCGHAGEWEVSNQIQVETYVTDNVNLTSDGKAGVGLNLRPQVSIQGEGARVQGDAIYEPSLNLTVGDGSGNANIAHTLDAGILAELARERLFVEATATARLIDTSSVATGSDAAVSDSGNTTQSFSASVSPYHVMRLGSQASLTTRLDADTVWTDGSDTGLNSTGLSASVVLASGPRFTRAPWSLSAAHRIISYEDREDSTSSVSGQVGYRFDSHWRTDVQLGYQNADVSTLRDSTSGVSYSTTVFWNPNPRFSTKAQWGHQYYGSFWNVDIQHALKKVAWSLTTRREITNTRASILRDATSGNLDGARNVALPPGIDPTVVVGAVAGSVDEDYLSTEVGGSVEISGRRTQVGFDMSFENREYELTRRRQDVRTVGMYASRQMAGRKTAFADIYRQQISSDLQGDSGYWRYGVGVSRAVGRYTSLSLRLSRLERSGAGTSDFTEHRIGLVLTTKMF